MSKVIQLHPKHTPYQYLDQLIQIHLAQGTFPGVEILVGVEGTIRLHQAWGHLELSQTHEPLAVGTIYDIASITKPIATATAVMMLQEQGLLDIYEPISSFLPDFQSSPAKDVTLQQLLSHSSGYAAWENLYENATSKQDAWERLTQLPLSHSPGTKVVYSCLGYLILGELVAHLTQMPLSEFCHQFIFEPLGLEQTRFHPLNYFQPENIAPTQFCPFRKKLLRGTVHDENAYIFNEAAGNAGVFSTAHDLFLFSQMILNNGLLNDIQILSEASIQEMTSNQHKPGLTTWGLGWDFKAHGQYYTCGSLFPDGAIGHTGFTGTSLWIDIESQKVIIILSNRVHLSREKNSQQMKEFRARAHNLLYSLFS